MERVQHEEVKKIIGEVIRENCSSESWSWLSEKCGEVHHSPFKLNIVFVNIPRRTGKTAIQLSAARKSILLSLRPGFTIENWTIDRLCRVWLLLHINSENKTEYLAAIENLITSAEMNELVALYSALPVLQYPESWQARCSEGIRSNIADVLEAIICNNPYPADYLSDPAWNQLVMKAFFTERAIHQIIGLDQRANQELARMLCDYASERWAASRNVHPMLWRCVGKFIDEKNFPAISRIFSSDDTIEKQAAALACFDSNYPAARIMLETDPALKQKIESGQLSWNTFSVNPLT